MTTFTRLKSIAAVSAIALLGMGVAASAETVGPVTDELGVIKIPKGAPIQIGGYWTISGPDTALGLDQKRGAEIAMDDWGNKVVGHKIKFIVEDSQCNAEGGQTAATKLASNQSLVLVIGPDCSSAATPGAPILWNAGIPSVATSTTAPSLTAADRKPGYHGFMRTIYNDLAAGAADADYFHGVLGCTTLATIHDGSPYAEQLVRVAETRFSELGGKVVASEAVAPTDVDMRPLLTGIATTKPCALYFPIFVAAGAQIARQVSEISGLEDTNVVGGSAMMAPGFIEAAGDAAVGFVFTNPDASTDAYGAGYGAFIEKYEEKYGEKPIQAFHANAYDGAVVALMGIEKVAKKDSEGNTYIGRKALRDALFATKGHEGVGGPIDCNEHGDCAGFKFAVYEFTDSDVDTFEIGVNPRKIYPK